MWLSLILSCWGAIKVLKPQPTKNKVGSSLSWLPLPSFGAVSLDLCLPRAITCSEQFFCFVFCSSLGGQTQKGTSRRQLAPWLQMGVGLPGLVGAPFYICHLRPTEKGRVKSFLFFLRKRSQVGILIARTRVLLLQPRVPSRCLWESQRHLACQGAPDGSPSSPGTGQGCGGQGLLPGLHSLCPSMALSLIGKPLIFRLKEGAVFAHSMPLRLFFSWCYSKFLLGSTKVDVLKTQQEAPFCVIHCHSNFFFF